MDICYDLRHCTNMTTEELHHFLTFDTEHWNKNTHIPAYIILTTIYAIAPIQLYRLLHYWRRMDYDMYLQRMKVSYYDNDTNASGSNDPSPSIRPTSYRAILKRFFSSSSYRHSGIKKSRQVDDINIDFKRLMLD